jgi:hypothetical protein
VSRLGASWLLAVMLWIAGCNGSDSTPTLTRPQALTRPPALSLVPGREKQKRTPSISRSGISPESSENWELSAAAMWWSRPGIGRFPGG